MGIFFVFLCATNFAQANIGDLSSFGSKSASLAGNKVAGGFDSFTAYSNPAALSAGLSLDNPLEFGLGVIILEPKFNGINNVVIHNTYTSDNAAATLGDVDTNYRTIFSQTIGMRLLASNWWKTSFGITVYLPLNHLAYIDSGEAFVPEYVLYQSRFQRPQFEISLGTNPAKWFSFGAGLHMGYALTSQVSTFLTTSSAKTSSMRVRATLKPKISPFFGVLFQSSPEESEKKGALTIGSVIRLPLMSPNNMQLNATTAIFGSAGAPQVNLLANAALFYEPLSVEIGTTYKVLNYLRTYLQVDFQKWSIFEPSALTLINKEGLQISTPTNPYQKPRDIYIPRIGQEITLGNNNIRLGYAFRPGIYKNAPNSSGNAIDPDSHIFTAGAGIKFSRFFLINKSCRLDVHAAYHSLVNQTVTKTAGNEAGNLTDAKIGHPGYKVGGYLYGGGLSFHLEL